jgi:hypothetical protein
LEAKDARSDARAALDVVIANFSTKVTTFPGDGNAERVHVGYWRRLAEHHKRLQPGYSPDQVIAFVDACSRPVFPRETTRGAVKNFAYRFLKRARE